MIPPRIKAGETLGIVAPAGPIKADKLLSGLSALGKTFTVRLAPSLTMPRPQGLPSYLAASDEVRAAELNAMFKDSSVRAILLARGGYGITRILHLLDADALRADPKPIVGFSDGTALLSWAVHAGVRGIHGPVLAQMGTLPPADIARLHELLMSPDAKGPRPWKLDGPALATSGHLVPANLTMASMLVGTPWELPLTGAVALLEEVGEKPYELDRYLTQLAMTKALARTHAVVLGDLIRCTDPLPPAGGQDAPEAALATIRERLPQVLTGAPVGHGDRNEPLPFGAQVSLENGVLTLEEAAVA